MVENYQEMLSSEHSGFIRHNGIRVVSVDEEKSVLTADVTPENSNIWGGVHGGFLYASATPPRARSRASTTASTTSR